MRNKIIGVALIALALCSCRSSKSVEPMFYVLEYPSGREISVNYPQLPLTVEIDRVDVNPAYSSNQIAIREKSNRLRYFAQHRWAVRPEQSISRYVMSFFDQHKVFQSIDTRLWKMEVDYKLLVVVHHLEVTQEKSQFMAHLSLEIILMKAKNGQVVSSHEFSRSQPLAKRDLNLFASELGAILFEELEVFTTKAVATLTAK